MHHSKHIERVVQDRLERTLTPQTENVVIVSLKKKKGGEEKRSSATQLLPMGKEERPCRTEGSGHPPPRGVKRFFLSDIGRAGKHDKDGACSQKTGTIVVLKPFTEELEESMTRGESLP